MRLPVVLPLVLALTLSIIGPSPSEAVEVPVSYLVDSRTLKRTTVLGDSLTFALYSDDACTVMVHNEAIEAGSPDLLIEKVLFEKVKKQRPKPPNAARLQTTLFPPETEEQFFLKVTGNGIVPVGDECQPLGPHPASNGDSTTNGLAVYDTNDKKVGDVVSIMDGVTPTVVFDIDGHLFALEIKTNDFRTNVNFIWFESDNCSGQPFMERIENPIERVVLTAPGNTVYVAEINAVPQTRTVRSNFDDAGCHVFTLPQLVVPAVLLVDLDTLFTGPFEVRKGM